MTIRVEDLQKGDRVLRSSGAAGTVRSVRHYTDVVVVRWVEDETPATATKGQRFTLTAPQVAPTLTAPGTSPEHIEGRSIMAEKKLAEGPKAEYDRAKWARERTERSIERLTTNLEAAKGPQERKDINGALKEARSILSERKTDEARAKAAYTASKAKPKAAPVDDGAGDEPNPEDQPEG